MANETVAEILAEMRQMGNYQSFSGDYAARLANRLEAATEREVGVSKSATTTGDAARMREALAQIRAIAESRGAWDVQTLADTALAAPPRQCDVGTAEEQRERFNAYCDQRACESCDLDMNGCRFQWAQMPYEEGGAES